MAARAEQLSAALAGRYRIERELGRGGMATVYLGEDLKHHRPVAIKVLDPELAAAIGTERFLREIDVAARLNHLHILALLDSGAAGDLLYYVTPYAEDGSLRQRLQREKQLPLAEALRLTREVADAIDYAHRRGTVHRDIKPENILLVEQHAVVADFGIARAIMAAGEAKLTGTGVVIGTPVYMSPEQGAGSRDLDGRSDIYSLGCVLYEMLAGQPPFTGPTSESLIHQHLSVEPRSVSDLRPAVPAAVVQALRRALAKSPADRFQTAAGFAEALAHQGSAAVEEIPTVVVPPKPVPPRRLALFGAAAAGVLVVAALLLLRPERHTPEPAKPVHARSSIAVLPFQNLSADGPHAFFAGGLHDELLTQLSKVAALKVISRTSVMSYVGTDKKLGQIAEELGVGSVVEGSVQVVGRQLRVNVQLIDAATDEHLWAESYDRTLDDAFAIQSEVAQRIVVGVGAAFAGAEQKRLSGAPTSNAEAYLLYLQGLDYMARPGFLEPNLEGARQVLERAVGLDPDFANARAWLSRAHAHLYWHGFDPSAARLARARAEAEAALRLAPDLPEAHIARGWVHYANRNYRPALDEYSIALKGLPSSALVWRFIGIVQRRLGNWSQTIAAFERAAQLDPRDADLFFYLGGHTYRLLRRYPDAVRAYERALSIVPDWQPPAVVLAWTYLNWQGRPDSLRAVLGRLPRDAEFGAAGSVATNRAELLLYERNADSLLLMPEMARPNLRRAEKFFESSGLYAAWAHVLRGDRAAARAAFESALPQLDSRLREQPERWNEHYARGMALAGLGRRNEALREARWLQRSTMYRDDPIEGPILAESRALILAQLRDADGACDELERLLAGPTDVTVGKLRLYPLWDPIREHPRFRALLASHGSRAGP